MHVEANCDDLIIYCQQETPWNSKRDNVRLIYPVVVTRFVRGILFSNVVYRVATANFLRYVIGKMYAIVQYRHHSCNASTVHPGRLKLYLFARREWFILFVRQQKYKSAEISSIFFLFLILFICNVIIRTRIHVQWKEEGEYSEVEKTDMCSDKLPRGNFWYVRQPWTRFHRVRGDSSRSARCSRKLYGVSRKLITIYDISRERRRATVGAIENGVFAFSTWSCSDSRFIQNK